jgi:hypothetical protein
VGKRKYSLNESAFELMSPECAYWLGFITADGCIRYNGKAYLIKFCLHKQDTDYLKKFQKFCGSNHPIYSKNENYLDFCFSSEQMFYDIESYGIVPRKTYAKHSFISKIPDRYKHCFIAGLFDGDGTVIRRRKTVKYKDKKYIYEMCAVRVLSNYNTMKDIEKYVANNFNFKTLKVKNNYKNMLFSIEWSSQNDLKEFYKMYSLSPIRMERKYDKLSNFLVENDGKVWRI